MGIFFLKLFCAIFSRKCSTFGFSIFFISRSSRNFDKDLEEPRSDKIYSSGNRGVKKGLGPRGTRNGELLVPSLIWTQLVFLQLSMKLLHNLHAILFHPHDEWFPQIFCSCQFHLQDYLPELEYLLYFLDRHNGQLKLLRAKTSTCFH